MAEVVICYVTLEITLLSWLLYLLEQVCSRESQLPYHEQPYGKVHTVKNRLPNNSQQGTESSAYNHVSEVGLPVKSSDDCRVALQQSVT